MCRTHARELGSDQHRVIFAADAATIARALLRPHREPASRLAWIITVLALPIGGVMLYLLLGETRISGKRRERGKRDRFAPPATTRQSPMQQRESCARPLGAVRAGAHGQSPRSDMQEQARLARDSNAPSTR